MTGVGEDIAQEEVWRAIEGYEGYYEVSDLGRVRSLDREITVATDPTRAPFVTRRKGKDLKPGIDRNGHVSVSLYREGECSQPVVHVLVLEAFVGARPPDHIALPLDGDPTNCRLDNLRWARWEDSQAQKEQRGTHKRGEGHPSAKLSAADVARIRADSLSPSSDLAAQYGVHASQIRRIRSGEHWALKPISETPSP